MAAYRLGRDVFPCQASNRRRYPCGEARLFGDRGAAQALDGEAGLLPAYRPDHRAPAITLFDGAEPEIMSVYFKAAPVCNFAQTPCQATIKLASEEQIDPARITAINVRVSAAAQAYPGCDYAGPFERVLQAK